VIEIEGMTGSLGPMVGGVGGPVGAVVSTGPLDVDDELLLVVDVCVSVVDFTDPVAVVRTVGVAETDVVAVG
jgi:hypothetical protein